MRAVFHLFNPHLASPRIRNTRAHTRASRLWCTCHPHFIDELPRRSPLSRGGAGGGRRLHLRLRHLRLEATGALVALQQRLLLLGGRQCGRLLLRALRGVDGVGAAAGSILRWKLEM